MKGLLYRMNKLQIFKSNDFADIRVTLIDNEPWFVGKDVAIAFGDSNYRRSLAKLDDDEKGVSQISTHGGVQEMIVINESGLYSLLFYMQPQKAKGVSQNENLIQERIDKLHKFKRWVTSEVLPSIRKHGMYAVDDLINNPELAIQAFTALKEEREKNRNLNTKVKIQEQQISELQPKACYYDLVLNCPDLISVTEIAKDFGKTAKWLNNFLCEQKIQFKQGGIWILYKKYAEKGYTSTKTHTVSGNDGTQHSKVHTYWTQKGRLFIYEILKSKGILPIVERE